MADQVLKLKEIEDFFVKLTCEMLGIDPNIEKGRVRKTWPTNGAPSWKIDEDIVFLRITPVDDKLSRQLNVIYSVDPLDTVNLKKKTGYTRVHKIDWCLYGPSSYDNADLIRNLIFDFDYMTELKAKNLFLVTDVPMPTRLPELYNGQWWERTDFSATFNESAIRESKTHYITSTNYTIIKDR